MLRDTYGRSNTRCHAWPVAASKTSSRSRRTWWSRWTRIQGMAPPLMEYVAPAGCRVQSLSGPVVVAATRVASQGKPADVGASACRD